MTTCPPSTEERWCPASQSRLGHQRCQVDEKLSGGLQTLVNVEGVVDVRIVDETLPPDSGSRLLQVSSHDDTKLTLQFVGKLLETSGVFLSDVQVVDRARADDDQQSVVFACDNFAGANSTFLHCFQAFRGGWDLRLQQRR